ncbi:MAG TPA: cation transporter [Mycobacteriales bacterium]|nr:cation transporter [Mycobacteriales bacterium]HVU61157.1 cation transporter [Mycobacteriales bacterium]
MHDLTLETAPQREVRAGLAVSAVSIGWTAATSAVAIAFGILANSVVLVAFGAVGLFDMAGSIALVAHFRHALRHQTISEGHERVAHLIVSYGMLTVGVATVAASVIRLADGGRPDDSLVGLVTSAASIVALGYLGARKRRIGRSIPSQALVTDGWLSLTGCATGACAVAGLGLRAAFGWTWVDPSAALGVAVIAIGIASVNLRHSSRAVPSSSSTAASVS